MPAPPPSYLSRISKGVVHQKIEALVNRNPPARKQFLTALRNSPQDYVQILVQHVGVTPDEEQFLRTYWYNPNGWWPDQQPIEPRVRQSLIDALGLAVERDLPIDCYQLVAGSDEFEVIIVSSDWQITRLMLTPPIPSYAQAV